MKTTRFPLAAGFTLAMIFTLGCPNSGGNGDSSSCVQEPVTIGTQVWQKCNLNVEPTGENGAATNSACYDNDPANCAIYGRLYDWATAMALPANCNENSCSSKIKTPHKGICPSGWHIPSNEDWDNLMRYVDGTDTEDGMESPYDSKTAGRYLKAKNGWNEGGNGEDKYGFSALPDGRGESDGDFNGAGYFGNWWSSEENGVDIAYSRYMDYRNEEVNYLDYYYKRYLYNIRCIQD